LYFEAGVILDIGAKLHIELDDWFGRTFDEKITPEDTEEDFDSIFSAVWDYIEEKGLY